MKPAEQSTIARAPDSDDVVVKLRVRASALRRLTGNGLKVNGVMQFVSEPDGAYSICVWSAQMPDWPDPVPANEAARVEIDEQGFLDREQAWYCRMPWRIGRRVGRTVYAQPGSAPADTDPLIGMMDAPDFAARAVESHNHLLALSQEPSVQDTDEIVEAQADLQTALGIYRLDHGRGDHVEQRMTACLERLRALLAALGRPMAPSSTREGGTE